MKRIDAYIRPHVLEPVREALVEMGVQGLSAVEIRGFGRQKGHSELFRGSEYENLFMPKVKLEILVNDDIASAVVDAIISVARTGKVGDGKIAIIPVDDVIRIRTGESGASAI